MSMSCYGFGYSPKQDDAKLPTVSRAEPLVSTLAPLATPLVLNPLVVSQDTKEVIIPLSADLLKATHSQFATRLLRRNAEGTPDGADSSDFPSEILADKNVPNISKQTPVTATNVFPDPEILAPDIPVAVQVLTAPPDISHDINISAIRHDIGNNMTDRVVTAKVPDKRVTHPMQHTLRPRPRTRTRAPRIHALTPTKEASNGYHAPPWSAIIAF
jgi:hypothetical protein